MCVYVCASVHACTCVCVSMRRCVWMETILQRLSFERTVSCHCNCPISGWQSLETTKYVPTNNVILHYTQMHRLQLATIGLFAMQSRAAAAPKPFAPQRWIAWCGMAAREEKRTHAYKRRSCRIEFRECMASDAVCRLLLIPSLFLIPFLVQQVEARRKSVTNYIIMYIFAITLESR